MLQYSFDADLAKEYGVPEAIFVHRLYWWVRDNAANNRNLKDGRYWTYDNMTALIEIFPFWSRRQLQGIIGRCRDKALIITAEYNEDRRDRTTWYTVTDTVIRFYEQTEKPASRTGNAMHEMVQCKAQNGAAQCTDSCTLYKEQLEDQLEDERESTREEQQNAKRTVKKLKPEEPQKTYGEFSNVHLTDTELVKLLGRWTAEQVKHEIEALSAYMKSKGKAYKDHYATLTVWMKRDFPAGRAASGGGRVLVDDD